MIVARLIAPYDKEGNSNLRFAKEKSGVYMIFRNGKIAYIGYSATNLYKTCMRHFQEWNSKYQVVVTYKWQLQDNDFKIRIILCSAARAEKLEKALIIKHKPKDNPNKLPGYKLNRFEEKAYDDYTFAEAMPVRELEDAPF